MQFIVRKISIKLLVVAILVHAFGIMGFSETKLKESSFISESLTEIDTSKKALQLGNFVDNLERFTFIFDYFFSNQSYTLNQNNYSHISKLNLYEVHLRSSSGRAPPISLFI